MQKDLLCAKPGVRNESILKRTSMAASSHRSVSNARRPAVGQGDSRWSLSSGALSPVLTAGSLQPKSETEIIPRALGRISVYPDKGKVSNFCQS